MANVRYDMGKGSVGALSGPKCGPPKRDDVYGTSSKIKVEGGLYQQNEGVCGPSIVKDKPILVTNIPQSQEEVTLLDFSSCGTDSSKRVNGKEAYWRWMTCGVTNH